MRVNNPTLTTATVTKNVMWNFSQVYYRGNVVHSGLSKTTNYLKYSFAIKYKQQLTFMRAMRVSRV